MDDTAFYTARYYRTAARNREYVFNRHQERFVFRTIRLRNVVVYRIHQFNDRIVTDLRVAVFQNCQSGTFDNRNLVARKTVRAQQIADFHFYQFQKFRIVYLVYLVHVNDNRRYTYLTSQKNVFARLRHRTVCG